LLPEQKGRDCMLDKIRKNKALLLAIIAVLILLMGALTTILIVQSVGGRKPVQEGFSLETHTLEPYQVGGGPLRANLQLIDGQARHLANININLGIYKERTVDSRELREYQELLSLLRRTENELWSAIRDVLWNTSYYDLQGLQGQDLLAELILTKLREVYETDRIGRVYFQKLQLLSADDN
jgi:flagellar basal body-associated protein FliL